MLILASPRFSLLLLFSSLVPTSTLQTRALLPRFQRKHLCRALDTLRFPLSNRREYRTLRACHLVISQCALLCQKAASELGLNARRFVRE